ncbi:sensor domain-containing protein [Lichenihabitans psoromatis]|uniref:sensor domain-containing protein n=1 Tax=Lichenihabitans psoromatis TaxID=2528642 RepID=UPI001035C5CA|nr:EAL domain-containing protein [Lichenihabitans psoromatis]
MTALTSPSFDALQLLFQSSADCIKLLNLRGQLIIMNLGGTAAMELESPDQLAGKNWIEFWVPGERSSALQAIEAARAGGVGRSFGFLPTAKGTPKWWDSIVTPVRNPDGQIEQILVVSRDVSERHKSDQQRRDLANDLQAALRRTNALLRATSEIVWQSDSQRNDVNVQGWTEFTGRGLFQIGRTVWLDAIHPHDRHRVDVSSRDAWAAGVEYYSKYRLRHRTGEYRWVEDRAVPLCGTDGEIIEWIGVITDMHAKVISDQALRESEERLRLAVAASRVGIWDVDLLTNERRWSVELKAMLGLHKDVKESEALLFQLVHHADRGIVEEAHRATFLQTTGFPSIIFRIHRADTGEERWIQSRGRAVVDQTGKPIRRNGTFQDITDQKRMEVRLWQAANEDSLTKLPNRYRFNIDLETAIANAETHEQRLALFIVDLDRFKEVNDTLGHDVGDQVLRSVASRLLCLKRDNMTVARLGGDEFAVLLTNAGSAAELETEAANLIRALIKPISISSGALNCVSSLGVAIYPDHDIDGRELLKNADLALYSAKRAGRAQFAFFDRSMKCALLSRIDVLKRTREAVSRGDIVPFYQPKVAISGDKICGFEALLRIREGSSLISPAAFLEAFHDPELSVQMGQQMLGAVLQDMRSWHESGVQFGNVALNVSATEFFHIDIAETWLARLRAAGLPTSMLQLEVTESVFLDGSSDVVGPALSVLSQAGIEVAFDDFGTGFASLTHLRKFPVRWLKIDRSFVSDLGSDNDANAIVSAVISLAHGIGLRVIAEGVETSLQASILTGMGCDGMQGYLAARPMPASDVPNFVKTWRGLTREGISMRCGE